MEAQLVSQPNIQIDEEDKFLKVTDGINYNVKNPLGKLMTAMEEAFFFAEDLHYYLADSVQFLFPFDDLALYGPAGADANVLDPTRQDNKTDFQKQNIKEFILTDTFLARGWVNVGGQIRPFLKLSYLGGP